MKKLLFILSVIFSVSTSAQEIKVTGVVTDDTKAPLIGATVLVKGTQNASITDLDGKFAINAKTGAVLVISFIGYETKTVTVNDAIINVVLSSSGEMLQDIVIIGSRNPTRTVTESAVPIDVINMKAIASQVF